MSLCLITKPGARILRLWVIRALAAPLITSLGRLSWGLWTNQVHLLLEMQETAKTELTARL